MDSARIGSRRYQPSSVGPRCERGAARAASPTSPASPTSSDARADTERAPSVIGSRTIVVNSPGRHENPMMSNVMHDTQDAAQETSHDATVSLRIVVSLLPGQVAASYPCAASATPVPISLVAPVYN